MKTNGIPRRPHRLGAVIGLGMIAAACTDQVAPLEPLAPPEQPAMHHGPADQLDPGLYWRATDTLWVFDRKQEVGIGTHFGDALSWSQIGDLKMRLTRITLYIHAYHETPGWKTSFEQSLSNACNQGLVPVVVVHAGEGEQYVGMVKRDYDWFASFMSTVVSGNPCVRFWQLWNEVEADFAGSRVFGDTTASPWTKGWNYAQMLKKAYPAIKTANPNAWVVTSGMVSVGPTWNYLRGIYDGGGRQYFDFLAMHAYGSVAQWDPSSPDDSLGVSGDGLRSRAERYHVVLQEKGDVGRPLWVTEFGTGAGHFVSAWGPETGATYDTHQKNWWSDALTIANNTRYFHKLIGYQLFAEDDGAAATDDSITGRTAMDYTLGVLRSDRLTPRPSYLYLRDQRNYNSHVFAHAYASGPVTVWAGDRRPVGYWYTRNGEEVTFTVTVDKLVPTVVVWEHDPTYVPPGGPGTCDPYIICPGDPL